MIGTGFAPIPCFASAPCKSTIRDFADIPWSAVSSSVTSGFASTSSPIALSRIDMCSCDSGSSGAYVCIA